MVLVLLMRPVSVSPSVVLTALVLGLLVANSCVAMRRALARGDHASAAFVAGATLLLAALLATVRAHERLAGDGGGDADRRRRGQLKAASWALSTALTCMFAHRVAALAPAPSFAVLVWVMAAATVAGGFCCLFELREGDLGDGADVLGDRRRGLDA